MNVWNLIFKQYNLAESDVLSIINEQTHGTLCISRNKSVQSPCNSSGQEDLVDKVKLYGNQSS